jgi:hypothetical protein
VFAACTSGYCQRSWIWTSIASISTISSISATFDDYYFTSTVSTITPTLSTASPSTASPTTPSETPQSHQMFILALSWFSKLLVEYARDECYSENPSYALNQKTSFVCQMIVEDISHVVCLFVLIISKSVFEHANRIY